MPTTVKKVWLEDKDGVKIAPKTLVSQVQTSDGVLLEDKLHADLDALKEEVLEEAQAKIEEHNADITSHNDIRDMIVETQNTANTANTTASDAQSTANEAKTAAANAQTTADSKAPAYTYGTADMTAGSSALETGKLYFVYE